MLVTLKIVFLTKKKKSFYLNTGQKGGPLEEG